MLPSVPPAAPRGKQTFDFPNADTTHLFDTILSLRSVAECESFFRDLCTLQELHELSERWKIAGLIWAGYPYRSIMKITKTSSTTVARASHWLQYGNGGFRMMCARVPLKLPDEPDRSTPVIRIA